MGFHKEWGIAGTDCRSQSLDFRVGVPFREIQCARTRANGQWLCVVFAVRGEGKGISKMAVRAISGHTAVCPLARGDELEVRDGEGAFVICPSSFVLRSTARALAGEYETRDR